MASEAILKELYKICTVSSLFKGKTDADIKKACFKHTNKSDEFIRGTINNIKKNSDNLSEDIYIDDMENGLNEGLKKVREEANHRFKDAEKILDKLMQI